VTTTLSGVQTHIRRPTKPSTILLAFARISPTSPGPFATTLHQHATLPPPARPTIQAGTSMVHAQVARPYCRIAGFMCVRARVYSRPRCVPRLFIRCDLRDDFDYIGPAFGKFREKYELVCRSDVRTRAIAAHMAHIRTRRSSSTATPAPGPARR
jgi:hypothetical protein